MIPFKKDIRHLLKSSVSPWAVGISDIKICSGVDTTWVFYNIINPIVGRNEI